MTGAAQTQQCTFALGPCGRESVPLLLRRAFPLFLGRDGLSLKNGELAMGAPFIRGAGRSRQKGYALGWASNRCSTLKPLSALGHTPSNAVLSSAHEAFRNSSTSG